MVRFVVFLLFGLFLTTSAYSLGIDSLRLEKEGDRYFIIHQVDEKETLYSLSRRYGVPIPKILELNSSAKSGLGIGDILRIPYVPKDKAENGEMHIVKPQETLFFISRLYDVSVDEIRKWNNLTSDALNVGQKLIVKNGAAAPQPTNKGDSIFHVVVASETLYSISRQYEVQVLEIREWNDLEANSISPGQKLFVGFNKAEKPVLYSADTTAKPKAEPAPVSKPAKEESTPVRKPEEVVYVGKTGPETVTNSSGYSRLVENGIAGVIEGSEDNKKYLALHSTAKIGTIMQVRNEMNNKVVFVRVLGRLPDTGTNSGLLIRLSKAAYDRLGAIDKKFRVEISYVP